MNSSVRNFGKTLYTIIGGCVGTALLIFTVWAFHEKSDIVPFIKDFNLPYSDSITVGAAFNTFDPDGEWTCSVKSIKQLQKNGEAYVSWRGTGAVVPSMTMEAIVVPVEVRFHMTVIGENATLEQEKVILNDNAAFAASGTDAFSYALIMQNIYGNHESFLLDAGNSVDECWLFSVSEDISTNVPQVDTPTDSGIDSFASSDWVSYDGANYITHDSLYGMTCVSITEVDDTTAEFAWYAYTNDGQLITSGMTMMLKINEGHFVVDDGDGHSIDVIIDKLTADITDVEFTGSNITGIYDFFPVA